MSKSKKQIVPKPLATPSIVVEKKQVPTSNPVNAIVNNKITVWLCCALIALVSFGVYYNSIGNRFVLDDHGIIKSNKITKAGLSVDNIKKIFLTSHRAGDVSDKENSLYRPFTKLVFAAEWQLAGGDSVNGNPHFFHFWNIVIMALCCIVLFLVLYHALNKNWIIALFTALLFAVHPIHSEVVANVKSLDEILGALGILLAMRCFQLYCNSNNIAYVVAAALAYLMGLFSKESEVVAVALVPLLLWYFTKATKKQLIIATATMAVCAGIFLATRNLAIGQYHMAPPSALDNVLALTADPVTGKYNWALRFPTVVAIMGKYVYTLFYPYPLSCDYSYASITVSSFTSMDFWLSFLFFVGVIFFAIKTFMQKNIVGFAIFWFLISSSIVSNLFMVIGTSFGERLMFLPSIGWCLAVVAFLYSILKYKNENTNYSFTEGLKKHALLASILVVVCLVYSTKTISRNADWYSDNKLFSTDVEKFPNSTHLLFYWGNHISSSEYAEGKSASQITQANEEAKTIFRRSMGIYPALPSDGYNQFGKAFYNTGAPDSAMYYYQKAYNEDTTNSVFMNNMGTIYFGRQQYDSALKYFTKAYYRDTTTIDYLNNLGAIHGTLGHRDEAIMWFTKAYNLDSISNGGVLALRSIGKTYGLMGDSIRANNFAQKAEQINKTKTEKWMNEQQ